MKRNTFLIAAIYFLSFASLILIDPSIPKAKDWSNYRVLSVPFNESIQIVFRQYNQYIDVSWTRIIADKTSKLIPLYSLLIEHRGVSYPGFFNQKYREYNVRIKDDGLINSRGIYKRSNATGIRSIISQQIVKIADMHTYPERDIILRSGGIVFFLYELTGVLPRENNFHP